MIPLIGLTGSAGSGKDTDDDGLTDAHEDVIGIDAARGLRRRR